MLLSCYDAAWHVPVSLLWLCHILLLAPNPAGLWVWLQPACRYLLLSCLLPCSDRVMNLYFAYLFVLRAVMKAAPVLTQYEYVTGLQEEDALTQQLITRLVRVAA